MLIVYTDAVFPIQAMLPGGFPFISFISTALPKFKYKIVIQSKNVDKQSI